MTSVCVIVSWRNSYIFLAHFAINWSHDFFYLYFFPFFLLLQKKLPASSPTMSTKPLCIDCCLKLMDESDKRLLNTWTRFLSWMNFSEQWNSSTGFPFPRSWMMSLPVISSDSVCYKPFLVYEIFTLHHADRDMCCNWTSSSSSMLHDIYRLRWSHEGIHKLSSGDWMSTACQLHFMDTCAIITGHHHHHLFFMTMRRKCGRATASLRISHVHSTWHCGKSVVVSLGIVPDFMDTFAIVTGLYHHHHHRCQDSEVKLQLLDGREVFMYMHLLPQITRVGVRKAALTFSRLSHTFNMTLRWMC